MRHSSVQDARRHQRRDRHAGFTLLELLVVMTIVAALAVVAYPRYQSMLAETRVADGQALLMRLAGHLERCRSRTHSYADCIETPVDSDAGHYRARIDASPAAYRLTARHDAQAVPSACRELSLAASGEKRPVECW